MTYDIQCPNCGTRNGLDIADHEEALDWADELAGFTCNSCGKTVDPNVVQVTD